MMPNTKVSPDATRNSSSPYCTPFSSWMRKVPKSIRILTKKPTASRPPALLVWRFPSAHLAQRGRRIIERLHRHPDHPVLRPDHFTQVEVLHRVVALRHGPLPARGIDVRLLHRGDDLFFLAEIALD